MRRQRVVLGLAVSLFAAGCQLLPGSPLDAGDRPPVECRGVPQHPCAGFADSWRDQPEFAVQDVARVIVSCVLARCDESVGEVRVDVVLRDGVVVLASGGAYASAPEPAAPVMPASIPDSVTVECQGLARDLCEERALEVLSGLVGEVTRIVVRCDGICVPSRGRGETTVERVDQRPHTMSWEYESTSSEP